MKLAVTGASGLVGSALVPFLTTGGHEVCASCGGPRPRPTRPAGTRRRVRSTRRRSTASTGRAPRRREHRRGTLDGGPQGAPALEPRGAHAPLAETLGRLESKPSVLVSASAIGYYGHRGDAWLTEKDAPADDFLGRLSVEWERAAEPAQEAGIRVVYPRIGIVLESRGRRPREDAAPVQGRPRRHRGSRHAVRELDRPRRRRSA